MGPMKVLIKVYVAYYITQTMACVHVTICHTPAIITIKRCNGFLLESHQTINSGHKLTIG